MHTKALSANGIEIRVHHSSDWSGNAFVTRPTVDPDNGERVEIPGWLARVVVEQHEEIDRLGRILSMPPKIGSLRKEGEEFAIPLLGPNPVMHMILATFAELLTAKNAQNYVAIEGHHEGAGHIEIIVQRVGKDTTHTARLRAEAALKRAVTQLQELGGTWDEPLDYAPDPAPTHPQPVSERDWLTLDINEEPNVLRCARCGGSQVMPEASTPMVLKAMMAAFGGEHGECREGDATS